MTRNSRKVGSLLATALIVLVAAGCGSGSPTATAVPATQAPVPTLAPTPTPAPTPSPTPVPTPTAVPSAAAAADPMDGAEIADPYTFEKLQPALAELFESTMSQSLGEFSSIVQVGVRSAVEDGNSVAWVIIARFPDLPIAEATMLDLVVSGAADGGSAEKLTIRDHAARIIKSGEFFVVVVIVEDDIVMVMGESKESSTAVMTAYLKTNG